MLLNEFSVLGRRSAKKLRADHLRVGFGSFLRAAPLPPVGECLDRFGGLPADLRCEWERAVAEELLLLHACGKTLPADWRRQFAAVSPFGEDSPVALDECCRHPCACAVFPLAGEDTPGIGHVWIIGGLRHRDERNGVDVVPEGFGVCFVTTHTAWHGRSWQLAGMLAHRCVNRGGDPAERAALARNWIASGRIRCQGTVWVNLGNKLSLWTPRQWLLPMANSGDVPASSLRIRFATDLDGAWSHVTGVGIRGDAELPWPDRLDELHILVGGNIKAGVASALFSPPGTRVFLWHSESRENSEIPAQAIRLVISALCPKHVVEEPCRMNSGSLVHGEATLRNAFRNCPVHHRILFNVTSGNLLMRYAALSITTQCPNLELVYRDLDAEDFRFTRLVFTERPPAAGTYLGNPGTHPEIDWEFLFSGGRRATFDSPETMAEDFLSEVRKQCKKHLPG